MPDNLLEFPKLHAELLFGLYFRYKEYLVCVPLSAFTLGTSFRVCIFYATPGGPEIIAPMTGVYEDAERFFAHVVFDSFR